MIKVKAKLFIVTGLLLHTLCSAAQTQPEYRMEVGAGAGLAAYVGDLNGNLLKGMRPLGALVARYKLNPRMAWMTSVGYTQLKGSTANVDKWDPDLAERPIDFKTSLVDVQLRYEYNFWPFGTGREYHGAQPLTPFIALGLGFTVSSAKPTQLGSELSKTSNTALQMPIGFGVKYKVADRLNLSAECIVHFTNGDRIDAMPDPLGIKSHGLFKNTDGYTTLMVSLTYDFWERCRTCHNDRD